MRYIILLLFVLLMGCSPTPSSSVFDDVNTPDSGGVDDDGYVGDKDPDGYAPEVKSSIINLKSKYIGSTTKLIEPLTIYGQVVANDLRGEFSRTLIIEDATGGVEVSLDMANIAYEYPLGCWVRLVCDDLWLGSRGGTIVVGGEPTDGAVVGMIDSRDVESRLYYVKRGAVPYPDYVDIEDLDNSRVSCFVAIEGLRFLTDEGSTFCQRDPDTGRSVSTTHTLQNRAGDQIKLFVASTTDYGDDVIPRGYGTIYAVLDLYAGAYSLRIIDRSFDF